MGICMSHEQKAAAARSAELDKRLEADRIAASRTIKLLLLGAGESGKSTLVKQMKIIHGDGYTQDELRKFKPTICDNLVHSMRAVLEAMGQLQINLGDMGNRIHVKAVLTYSDSGAQGTLTPELSAALKSLRDDSGVQACIRRSNEYQLNDSAEYFFNSIDRISAPSYVPTEQDGLRARVRTTGVIETKFKYRDITYTMIDVGGQRTERSKWIHSFDDVTAIIFVTALSGYDMKLFEDRKTNRIHESLTLFEAICNNKFFIDTSMILFLNKTDLFSQKIARTPLSSFFPDFTGELGDAAAAREFLLGKFLALNRNPNKTIYEHFTCATDTGNIRHVFDTVSDIIIEQNLKKAGLGNVM